MANSMKNIVKDNKISKMVLHNKITLTLIQINKKCHPIKFKIIVRIYFKIKKVKSF